MEIEKLLFEGELQEAERKIKDADDSEQYDPATMLLIRAQLEDRLLWKESKTPESYSQLSLKVVPLFEKAIRHAPDSFTIRVQYANFQWRKSDLWKDALAFTPSKDDIQDILQVA